MKMRSKRLVGALVLAGISLSGLALAGAKYSRDVWVSEYSFGGSFGTTRNSADSWSWLRCEINSWGGYFCDAYDGTNYKSCSGSNPQLRATLDAMGSEDDLYADFSDGTCQNLWVSKSSINEPKAVGR